MTEYVTRLRHKGHKAPISYIDGHVIYCSDVDLSCSFDSVWHAHNYITEAIKDCPSVVNEISDVEIVTYKIEAWSFESFDLLASIDDGEFDANDTESILNNLLVTGVLTGFSNITNIDRIMTDPKYFDIVKNNVPSLMITEYKDYMTEGLQTCSADQLCAIIMLCTDNLISRYNIEDKLRLAIEREE